jgi:hydrogenase nickel incorporation protein HypB
MVIVRIPVVEKILSANDRMAELNRQQLMDHKVFGINVMASPGAGKTSFILETIYRIGNKYRIGVIEGDTAPVTIDAEKITALGIPAVHINTGGGCHLDANMITDGLVNFDLSQLDVMIVENVGNLICPAAWDLGTHLNLLVSSIPEGDDKPYKYPNIFRDLDTLIINKIDLQPYVEFKLDYFRQGVEMLNPGLLTFPLSCRTGEGFDQWIEWLSDTINRFILN